MYTEEARETVPAAVPSVFHNAWRVELCLVVKKSVPFTFVSWLGSEPTPGPVSRSFTITVPAAVPSLRHSSSPFLPSLAVK